MCAIESIRYIKRCFLQPSWLREGKAGLKINKRREIEGVIPENGFWSSFSVAHFTIFNVALLREVWGSRLLHIIACAVVSTKWKACAVLSLNLEWPPDVSSNLRVLNSFSPWYFISHILFFSKFALFLSYFLIPQILILLKMTGNKFYCLFQFGKNHNVFYWLHYCFVRYRREEFLVSVQKSQVVIVVFKGPATGLFL